MALTETLTAYGTAVGTEENGIAVYKGIPYGEAERFKAPHDPQAWQGKRIFDTFGPAPVQHAHRPHNQGWHDPREDHVRYGEDCLTLNIWTPARQADEKLPVLFWIFGGGFNNGHASRAEFDGRKLAELGSVVVTFDYRCGPLGFLALPELTAESPHHASGNYGTLDQIQALKWVQQNIAAFGGDPACVTVFGQSAGGISIRMLLTSPLTEHLFARAIIQSGGGLNEADPVRSLHDMEAIGTRTLERLHLNLDDIRAMDVQAAVDLLAETVPQVLPQPELFIFQPCLDGYSLIDEPGRLLACGRYHQDVQIMIGSVQGDSWMFTRKVRPQLMKNEQALRAFAYSPEIALARKQLAAGRAPVYAYFFERSQPNMEHQTPHSSEIAYIFGTLDEKPGPWTNLDRSYSSMMSRLWSNFARCGNPNGEGLPEWPQYTENAPLALDFTDEGVQACNLVDNEEAEKVIRFVEDNPGMLESLQGFAGSYDPDAKEEPRR